MTNQVTEFGVLPYTDGSGDYYSIRIVTRENTGETIIEITEYDHSISITADEWPTLRKAIDAGVSRHRQLTSDLKPKDAYFD